MVKSKAKKQAPPLPEPVDVVRTKTPKELAGDYFERWGRALDEKTPGALEALKEFDRKVQKRLREKFPTNGDAIDKLGWVLRQHLRRPKPIHTKGTDEASLLRALQDPAAQADFAPISVGRSLLHRVIDAVEKSPSLHGLAFDLHVMQDFPWLEIEHLRTPTGARKGKSLAAHRRDRVARAEIEDLAALLKKWIKRVPRACDTKGTIAAFIRKEWKAGRWPRTRKEEFRFLFHGKESFGFTLENIPPVPLPYWEPLLRPFARELHEMRQARDVDAEGRSGDGREKADMPKKRAAMLFLERAGKPSTVADAVKLLKRLARIEERVRSRAT